MAPTIRKGEIIHAFGENGELSEGAEIALTNWCNTCVTEKVAQAKYDFAMIALDNGNGSVTLTAGSGYGITDNHDGTISIGI